MRAKKGLPWWAWVPFFTGPSGSAAPVADAQSAPSTRFNVHRDSIPLPMEPRRTDDLTLIKGLGLKSASVLNAAGINTFRQLSSTPVEFLREVLLAANLPPG